MNTLIEKLIPLGFDHEEASKRFMGNEALIVKFLKKYPAQCAELNFAEDVKNRDWVTGLEHSHTLKGVAGNLALSGLFDLYAEIVNRIRANDTDKLEDLCEEALELEAKICEVINSAE